MTILTRLIRHLWLDAGDARRAVGEDALHRLEARIAASEARHLGEICIYVEASLPLADLWRQWRTGLDIGSVVRERALSRFGRLGVWDTELNNGVLIYLQLAEHRIEIVADRGLARHVPAEEWAALLGDMGADFRAGRYEDGLARAVDVVGAELERHFPRREGGHDIDELPNRPRLG
ncbi:TPM domain-containing protein [Pseudothauera rhizosphaerae]|uniref:TPM domain-containing protein n=1 Tax=Pseudothauera rhizosphaerae TaxID=2565932 RepID=A0A4V3WB75_9RHOO|nr:TPM domain-containing protein [Pseudothauera rhizosphaerae]THF62136.1 TPM domain-containing protein [Pseudothauera rhizosphaerae]